MRTPRVDAGEEPGDRRPLERGEDGAPQVVILVGDELLHPPHGERVVAHEILQRGAAARESEKLGEVGRQRDWGGVDSARIAHPGGGPWLRHLLGPVLPLGPHAWAGDGRLDLAVAEHRVRDAATLEHIEEVRHRCNGERSRGVVPHEHSLLVRRAGETHGALLGHFVRGRALAQRPLRQLAIVQTGAIV